MRLNKLLAATSVAALFLGAASGASATIMMATFEGTVSSGSDNAGVFVAPGGDLSGYAYTQVFKYDTTLGLHASPAFEDYLTGGSYVGTTTPLLDSWVTINGVTRHNAGGYAFSDIMVGPLPFSGHDNEVLMSAENYTGPGGIGDYSLGRAFDLTPDPPISIEGSFSSAAGYHNIGGIIEAGTLDDTGLGFSTVFYQAYLNTTSVTVAPVGGVPEPASWALMILGFGGVATALRRRHSSRRAVPA